MKSKYRPNEGFRLATVGLLTLLAASCGGPATETDEARQVAAVREAEVEVETESQRLQAMRDSLEAAVRELSELGMSAAEADSLARERVVRQAAVVNAAKENLKRQKAYLEALRIVR